MYYLVNDFEFTRIKDVWSELLKEEKEIKTDKEYKFSIIDISLLKPIHRIGNINIEEM